MKAKVYKVVLSIVDHEGINQKEVKELLENVKFLYPSVVSIESREIKDWDDDHPLNINSTFHEEFERLFEEKE